MPKTYVVGDVHGCFDTLMALWPRLGFDLGRDRLWLVGDLVNRGPRSLRVLRWARKLEERLGERFRAVLGNHDLHLLARADGLTEARRKDTLDDVLTAPDREELVEWLAGQQLVHRESGTLLVHGGLLPQWAPEDAERLAREIEPRLRDRERRRALIERDASPAEGSEEHRLKKALDAFAGLRTCTAEGAPCRWKGPPEDAPPGCLAWFDVPGRRSAEVTVVFGHWAAMGLRVMPRAIALDSGCVWGNGLSAIRLGDREVFHQPTVEPELRAIATR